MGYTSNEQYGRAVQWQWEQVYGSINPQSQLLGQSPMVLSSHPLGTELDQCYRSAMQDIPLEFPTLFEEASPGPQTGMGTISRRLLKAIRSLFRLR